MTSLINSGWTALPDGRLQIDKGPRSSLRYGFDVAGILADGDAILVTTVYSQSGVVSESAGHSGTIVSCRVSGGTAGEVGSVTLRWQTTQGDTDERTMLFRLVER